MTKLQTDISTIAGLAGKRVLTIDTYAQHIRDRYRITPIVREGVYIVTGPRPALKFDTVALRLVCSKTMQPQSVYEAWEALGSWIITVPAQGFVFLECHVCLPLRPVIVCSRNLNQQVR